MRLGKKDGVGIISVGITNGYQNEALESLSEAGVDVSEISSLELIASIPFAKEKIETMISHCSTLLIAEELEGHIEKYVYMQAYKMGKQVKILGKEDGTYERIGEYDAQILRKVSARHWMLHCRNASPISRLHRRTTAPSGPSASAQAVRTVARTWALKPD